MDSKRCSCSQTKAVTCATVVQYENEKGSVKLIKGNTGREQRDAAKSSTCIVKVTNVNMNRVPQFAVPTAAPRSFKELYNPFRLDAYLLLVATLN